MSLRISSASESKSASDPCLKIRLVSSPEHGLLVSVSVSASELRSESVLVSDIRAIRESEDYKRGQGLLLGTLRTAQDS
jgi:hypothetical protein